jgi:hypothetical protein
VAKDTLVVTPTLGTRKSIARTILSVHSTAPDRIYHVVVGPIQAIKWIENEFPWICLLNDPFASGIYSALNHALKCYSDYEYFAYINDDDCWLPEFITLFDACDNDKTLDLVYARTVFYKNHPLVSWPSAYFPFPKSFSSLYAFGIPLFTQQSVLTKLSLVLSLGGFDEQYPISADTQLWIKVVESGARCRGVNKLASMYFLDGDRLSADKELLSREILMASKQKTSSFSAKKNINYSLVNAIALTILYRAYNMPVYIYRLVTNRVKCWRIGLKYHMP